MSLIIGAIIIVVIIAGTAFFLSGRLNSENHAQNEEKSAIKKERKEVSVEEELIKEEKKAKTIEENKGKKAEQLYRYINHGLQMLYTIHNEEKWDSLYTLGEISPELYKEKEGIIESLPSFAGVLLTEYFSCIDFKKEEGKYVGYVKDVQRLKKVFLQFMMPFYPYYYKQLSEGGLRYTALLHPNTLRLFQYLTGKKFRPGYHNRYTTGVRAFEWNKNRYKVYQKDGKLLCDAIFGTDGIIDGYGQKRKEDKKHPEWEIIEEGKWESGIFQSKTLRYEYKRVVK